MEHKTIKQMVMAIQAIFASNSHCQGLTITELLSAMVMGSIVIVSATSGFVNLLRKNQTMESRTIRHSGLIKALNYLQEDIKSAQFIKYENRDTNNYCKSSSIDSESCLVLEYSSGAYPVESCDNKLSIYYGLENIRSRSNQIWLKPAILKRKVICGEDEGNWTVVVDGLLGDTDVSVIEDLDTFCSQNGVNWTGHSEVYGKMADDKGGFLFCLHNNDQNIGTNRLVRIFLYGYIHGKDPISVNSIVFARSQ